MKDPLELLSRKPMKDFTPEDFKLYVRSLKYFRPARKTKTIKLKKIKPPFVWKLTKTGKISVKVNRTPAWLSREEIAQIALESKIEERLVWINTISRKKNPIRLSTQAEMDQISLTETPTP